MFEIHVIGFHFVYLNTHMQPIANKIEFVEQFNIFLQCTNNDVETNALSAHLAISKSLNETPCLSVVIHNGQTNLLYSFDNLVRPSKTHNCM